MLKIAICDDEIIHAQQMKSFLQTYLRNHPELPAQIQLFQSGKKLLEQAEGGDGFDLYILDIIMPELNGIETGLRLRALGEGGEIIYLTNSTDYAIDSYNVRAFFYLLKPVEKRRLFEVLDDAFKKLERRRAATLVSTADGVQRILLEDILYVERVGRRLRYYCSDGQVDSLSIRVSFHEAMEPLLAETRFYQCGASFVFNLQHVAAVKGQTVLLDNGQTVPLPRTAVVAFKNAWGNYWLREVE